MEERGKSQSEIVKGFLKSNPLLHAPWNVATFFETNLQEEELDLSLNDLQKVRPGIEEDSKEMVDELEKFTSLIVPLIRHIPLLNILDVFRVMTRFPDVLPFLPGFPEQPSFNIVNHMFKNDTMSSDQKLEAYQRIAGNTPLVVEKLISWRNEVAEYIAKLENYKEEHEDDLSEPQMERIEQFIKRSTSTLPLIDEKIGEKKSKSGFEELEFENFYKTLETDLKFQALKPIERRKKIRDVYNSSDDSIRKIIAGMQQTDRESCPPLDTTAKDSEKKKSVENGSAKRGHSEDRIMVTRSGGRIRKRPIRLGDNEENEQNHNETTPKISRRVSRNATANNSIKQE